MYNHNRCQGNTSRNQSCRRTWALLWWRGRGHQKICFGW
jgi:hypothetical protein